MSFTKTIVAVAAVGALTAATAVPAMALENEFHGLFRLRGIVSNFDNSNSGAASIGNGDQNAVGSGSLNKKDANTTTYFEQRARLMYIAKANDDLKLVTHFEFDSRWGDNSYNSNSTTRNNGGGVGADQTNLETKNIYLEFKIPSTPVVVKAGIQGFTDNYKGIIFNNDAAGVTAVAKQGWGSVQAAYFRFDDATGTTGTNNTYYGGPGTAGGPGNTANFGTGPIAAPTAAAINVSGGTNGQVGNNTRDFMTLGAKLNLTKDLVLGADYYLLYSDLMRNVARKTYINMVGVNGEAKFGPATVSGFGLYQFGQLGNVGFANSQDVSAFAGNVAGKVAVGPGTAKLTVLYVSGDKNTGGTGDRNDFQTIMERGATTSGHTFFEANSQLLLRNMYAIDKTDRAVVFDLNNAGKGVIAAFGGYDLTLGKFFANSNVGIGAVAKDNGNAQPNGGNGSGTSNVLGTELNTEIGYKVYDNMTASVSAAYLFLGDFYSNAGNKADNPYSTKVMLNYTF